MDDVTLGQVVAWTEADPVGNMDRAHLVGSVSTDSRTLVAGELFFALKGPTFDGHRYVAKAFEKGAVAAVVERGWQQAESDQVEGPLLLVEDPLLALGDLARNYRQRFDVPVVGVVGSSGKTTTKEMIAAVLQRRYKVLKTPDSHNNEIGVPLTLLQQDSSHEAVVLELAARKVGDINYLCSIAKPNLGVLLNIGTAHLEIFGSVERVAEAKGELLDNIEGESSMALVNFDDCVIAKERLRTKGRLLGFSLESESQFCGEGFALDQEGRGHFSLLNTRFKLQVPGRHNVYNALAAIGVGDSLAVPPEEMRQALASFSPVASRSEILRKNGICVINDCYNANPESLQAALEVLDSLGEGRKIAVLGDMLELGERSKDFHREAGAQVGRAGVHMLFAVGPMSLHTVEAARQAGIDPQRALHFADKSALAKALVSNLEQGDIVLLKASRGIGLDDVADQLI